MNNTLIMVMGCHICRVKYLPQIGGKSLPGEVICGRDTAYFEFASSRNVVINDDREPCFGPGRASFPQVGDEIVAQVEERGRRGHYVVTAWTHARDWQAALASLKVAAAPKPAPAIPPKQAQALVAQVTTSPVVAVPVGAKVQSDRRNQTGRDRRQTSKPSRLVAQVPECQAALRSLENLPPIAEAEATAECSTAPVHTPETTAAEVPEKK